jgi:hypothetical protein
VDFGGVAAGRNSTRTVRIANLGSATTTVSSELSSGLGLGFALGSGCNDDRLSPGASCELPVLFQSAAAGERAGSVLVTTDRGESASIELSAAVLEPSSLVGSASTFTFASLEVGATAEPRRWIIRNAGGLPTTQLRISLPSLSSSAFRVEHDCPDSLAPGAVCGFDITFAPRVAGPATNSISVFDDFSRTSLALSGTGLAP